MIETNWEDGERIYIPVCDGCYENLDPEYDFYDAVDAKKAAGWRSKKVDGEWFDYCPDCQKKAEEESVMDDFAGLKGRY